MLLRSLLEQNRILLVHSTRYPIHPAIEIITLNSCQIEEHVTNKRAVSKSLLRFPVDCTLGIDIKR